MNTIKNAVVDFLQDMWSIVVKQTLVTWKEVRDAHSVYPRVVYLGLALILLALFV